MSTYLCISFRLVFVLFLFGSCHTSLKHFSKEPMDKGLCDSLAFVKEEIAKGVSCLFDRYDFTLLRSDTLPGSGLVMIGEHLSTRLNEKNDAYATGSVRVVIEPIPNTNLCLIRVRWFAPLRKGYEAKQQQQEGLYQKKFLNELVFHIKHQSS